MGPQESFWFSFHWERVLLLFFKKKTTHIYAGDLGLIPGLGRSPGGGHGNPLQNSCLENSPWTEEPGEQQSMGSQESDMTERRSAHAQNK